MSKQSWERVLKCNSWNTVELRDNRYNQVIHLVTSADGAEEYYNVDDNPVRTEGLELARRLDRLTIEAWVGHPYIDVIDNSTDFDTKMRRMIAVSGVTEPRPLLTPAPDRVSPHRHRGRRPTGERQSETQIPGGPTAGRPRVSPLPGL